MKHSTKMLLLVGVVILLLLSACTRSISKPPVLTATPSAEVPFPFTTPDAFSAIKTQTAVALFPDLVATSTPEVVVATVEEAPAPETSESSGDEATAAPDTGSVPVQEPQPEQPPVSNVSIPEIVRPATYTLQKGEWPLCIARRFDLDISSFLAANGMTMESRPGVGVVLTIPSSGSWSANYGSRSLRAHPATYTVASGDTIHGIACKFGDVSPEQILAVNGLSSAGDISAGMKLNIP